MGTLGVELLQECIEAGLLLQTVEPGRPGGFLLQGQVHALKTAVLLGMAWLNAFDRDAEPEPSDGEFRQLKRALGLAKGTPLSERMPSDNPRSANSRSKAVMAGSSHVESRASQRSRKCEAWSVTVSG